MTRRRAAASAMAYLNAARSSEIKDAREQECASSHEALAMMAEKG